MLYPPGEPSRVRRLPANEPPHAIYAEESGPSDGIAVVFLHGGPGSGCSPEHRRYFDPDYYRAVLFDQRGCGRSTPLGATEGNRTDALVADMELIRTALGIERWVLFGGSWGAALALRYAALHPQRVRALVLRGVFLARTRDLRWVFGPDGAARLFPEDWDLFLKRIPPGERADPVAAYHRRVQGADRGSALAWARAWLAWEDRVATWNLRQDPDTPTAGKEREREPEEVRRADDRVLAKARIETHYAHHRYFLEENELLDGLAALPRVPIVLVQGRRDLVCPAAAAWAVHRRLPWSRLRIVPDAGHLASEPAMIDALVSEMDALRDAGV